MTVPTAQRNKKHNDAGFILAKFISADWKSHIGKTLVSLALAGLGTLMFVTGNFLLNVIPKLQTTISPLATLMKEEGGRAKRQIELATSIREVNQRREERFARINDYIGSNKGPADLAKLTDLVNETSQEAARDSGLLSGFTPETTGLPVSFHESMHGFSQTELDFWHSYREALDATRKNPKSGHDKVIELSGRLPNMVYESSRFASSMQDAAKISEAHAQKLEDISKAAKTELEYDTMLASLAWQALLLSTFSFLLIACFLLLDWLQGKAIKKG